MGRRDDGIDLGIDATPRGPLSLNPPGRKPARRPSAWDEPMSAGLVRLVKGVAGLMGAAILGLVVEALLGRGDAPAPRPDPVPGHIRLSLDRMAERGRRDEAEADSNAGRAEAEAELVASDPASWPDRRAWREFCPEGIALAWARRARPGDYRVVTANVYTAVLVAFLEDAEGRRWALRAQMDPGAEDAEVSFRESASK